MSIDGEADKETFDGKVTGMADDMLADIVVDKPDILG